MKKKKKAVTVLGQTDMRNLYSLNRKAPKTCQLLSKLGPAFLELNDLFNFSTKPI